MYLVITGVVIVLLVAAIMIARKFRDIQSVSPIDFLRRMRSGAEFRDIEPAELQESLARQSDVPLIIDLREDDLYEEGHIAGAILIPFDDFMHEVLVE